MVLVAMAHDAFNIQSRIPVENLTSGCLVGRVIERANSLCIEMA